MTQDLRSLRAQGLLQSRTIWTGGRRNRMTVLALTRRGKEVVSVGGASDQRVYAGLVKPAEVQHDAAIYRMYQSESKRIERGGGRIRRIVLDYELKQKVFAPLAKIKAKAETVPPREYARQQAEVARENGLRVVRGKIPLPDLRIEYERANGERAHVDLELATHHYRGSQMRAKAEAGFKMYAPQDSVSRLSAALDAPGIVVEILSLYTTMSQIRLTNVERMQALQRLGYNEREARFLCLAALHGGYFLRRQYCSFLGKPVGGTAAALIEKVLAQGHAQVGTYAANTGVYHLAARPFYAALGQEDNRNRRERAPETVKNKLMSLDFVLAHPEREYLATEQEKLDHFTDALQLDKSVLPTKRCASSGRVTERYFVEKYPIFLFPSDQPASPPVVSFCFVDEGAAGIDGFSTFLQQYSRPLVELREFQIVYVAATDRLFQSGAGVFARLFEQCPEIHKSVPSDAARTLEHFKARRLYETRQCTSFDRAALIRFRNERQEFSGEKYEYIAIYGARIGLCVTAPLYSSGQWPRSPPTTIPVLIEEMSFPRAAKSKTR